MSYDLPNYDAWLERPYQRRQAQEPPAEVEDLLGTEFWYEGERAVVDSWEAWEDADEDGRYGGIDLVIRIGGYRTEGPFPVWAGGQEQNIAPDDLLEVLAKQDEHIDEDER